MTVDMKSLDHFKERTVYRATALAPEGVEYEGKPDHYVGQERDKPEEAFAALAGEWETADREIVLEKQIVKESDWVEVSL